MLKKIDFSKYGVIIGIVVVTLILSGVIFYFYTEAGAAHEKKMEELEALKKQIDILTRNDLHLDKENLDKATKNNETAKKYLESLTKGLQSRYPKPIEESEVIKNVEYKIRLKADCEEMLELLTKGNVTVPENLATFTFGDYLGQFYTIKQEDVFYIQQHQQIIFELIEWIERAKLTSLDNILRNKTEIKPVPVEPSSDFPAGYTYHTYILQVSGTYESVKKFVNSLNKAKYLFLIKSLDITSDNVIAKAEEKAGSNNASSTDDDDPLKELGLNKEQRIAINDLANVKLSITLDYIDFNSYALEEE